VEVLAGVSSGSAVLDLCSGDFGTSLEGKWRGSQVVLIEVNGAGFDRQSRRVISAASISSQ
jgi:hypothetical protein